MTLNDAYELLMKLAISDHELSLTNGRENQKGKERTYHLAVDDEFISLSHEVVGLK